MHNVSHETFDSIFIYWYVSRETAIKTKKQFKNVPRETISDSVEVILL